MGGGKVVWEGRGMCEGWRIWEGYSVMWFNLHQISKIKGYLSQDKLKTVVHAFVMSKMDYNNGLLVGYSKQLK